MMDALAGFSRSAIDPKAWPRAIRNIMASVHSCWPRVKSRPAHRGSTTRGSHVESARAVYFPVARWLRRRAGPEPGESVGSRRPLDVPVVLPHAPVPEDVRRQTW